MSRVQRTENAVTELKPDANVGRDIAGILARDRDAQLPPLLDAMSEAFTTGAPLTTAVRAHEAASDGSLLNALSHQHRVMALCPDTTPRDPDQGSLLPLEFCLQNTVMPWMRIGETLVVAGTDPTSFERLAAPVERLFGPVMFAVASEGDIHDAIAEHHAESLVQAAENKVPPEESCRDINAMTTRRALYALALLIPAVWLLVVSPAAFFSAVLGLAIFSLVLNQLLKLTAAIATLVPDKDNATAAPEAQKLPLVSVLVPLFQEENIATILVKRLQALRYPKSRLDVVLVLEAEDDKTRKTLAKTTLPPWMRVIRVPKGTVLTKPRALNFALNFCKADIVGIYDAEDAPDPDQIDRVVAHFRTAPPDVACVQGILDFYNPKSNWLARCFDIEYVTWFRLILPGLARLKLVLPLGGTTLFIRRSVLEEVHGWDAHNVTEDADLGIRLARYGYRTDWLPTVTREEANNRLWPWIRQRSRWLKGYMITYLVHMRSPVRLMQDLGTWKFLGFQVLFLATILQFALAPLIWSFWLVLLGVPHPVADHIGSLGTISLVSVFLMSEAISIGTSCLAVARSSHDRLFAWIPTMMFYFPLGVLALYKGLFELIARPFYWDKTSHGHSPPDPGL